MTCTLLYAQVYSRLQALHLSMSHSAVLKLLNKVGENNDELVKKWRDELIKTLPDGPSRQV